MQPTDAEMDVHERARGGLGRGSCRTWTLWSLRGLVWLWAGFWSWFAVGGLVSGEEGAWTHLLTPAGPALTMALLAIWRPATAGVLLTAAGLGALVWFNHPFARLVLAAPAIVLGVGLLLVTPRPASRPAAG